MTRLSFIASCKQKPFKWEHCPEVRLRTCEEAFGNQVKKAKKKKLREKQTQILDQETGDQSSPVGPPFVFILTQASQ